MGILSSTLLSGIGAVAILIGYGAIRKERSSGQRAQAPSPQVDQTLRSMVKDQSLSAIEREHAALQTQHQDIVAANHTLTQQVETLVAEKAALQKTLDRAWQKVADLETRITAVTEQPNPSAPEPAAELEAQPADSPSETAAPSLMPKPDLPPVEKNLQAEMPAAEASGPATEASGTETAANLSEPIQNTTVSSTDTSTENSTEKEIETVYEIEAAIANEDSGLSQVISAEPNPLQGKSLAISGSFKDMTVTEIKARLQSVGGRLQHNPDTDTDYIVVGNIPSGTSQRAEKLKIPQLTEEQFLNLLQESEVLVRERD